MEGVIVRLGSDPFFGVTHSKSRTAELTDTNVSKSRLLVDRRMVSHCVATYQTRRRSDVDHNVR
jgi:hypothetical protein